MADAGIASWESKYHYQFWRPVTGIREADPGTGPTGGGDGNPRHGRRPDLHRRSARRRATSQGPNFTPPFPAYPSGHAGFGGALFQMLRNFYGTDDIAFTFVSDEFNGVTRDNEGNVRPLLPRTFARSRRPRRRTARAASISASTGRSTRPRASPRAGASRTTARQCAKKEGRRQLRRIRRKIRQLSISTQLLERQPRAEEEAARIEEANRLAERGGPAPATRS